MKTTMSVIACFGVALSIDLGKITNNSNLINCTASVDRIVRLIWVNPLPAPGKSLDIDPKVQFVLTLTKYWIDLTMWTRHCIITRLVVMIVG